MSKVMILGAGVYQVPLIQTVKNLGHQAIVVSRDGDYPGFRIADIIYKLDTTDVEGILSAACAERIDAITTTGTDVAVPAIGAVCDALKLNGITAKTAARVTDKAIMKRAFVDGGIATSPFETASSQEKVLEAAARIGYPVMVKACDVSGSRGITKANSEEKARTAYHEAMKVTRAGYVVVEKYIEGIDIGFVAFASGGKLLMCLAHDKFIREVQGVSVSVGHAFPYSGGNGFQNAIESEVRKIVVAMGLQDGAIDGDLRIASDGSISVIEVAGRCGATCIPELVSVSLGVDFYEQIVRNALGESVSFPQADVKPSIAELLFSEKGGTVQRVDTERIDALREKYSAQIKLDVISGDQVRPMRNGTDRYGHLVMGTDDKTMFDRVLAEAIDCVRLA